MYIRFSINCPTANNIENTTMIPNIGFYHIIISESLPILQENSLIQQSKVNTRSRNMNIQITIRTYVDPNSATDCAL